MTLCLWKNAKIRFHITITKKEPGSAGRILNYVLQTKQSHLWCPHEQNRTLSIRQTAPIHLLCSFPPKHITASRWQQRPTNSQVHGYHVFCCPSLTELGTPQCITSAFLLPFEKTLNTFSIWLWSVSVPSPERCPGRETGGPCSLPSLHSHGVELDSALRKLEFLTN